MSTPAYFTATNLQYYSKNDSQYIGLVFYKKKQQLVLYFSLTNPHSLPSLPPSLFFSLSLSLSLMCLCVSSLTTGYYWIDPNVGNPSDAVQVYCKRPGCSCLDCEAPANSGSRQEWNGATNKYFTELGYEVKEYVYIIF